LWHLIDRAIEWDFDFVEFLLNDANVRSC